MGKIRALCGEYCTRIGQQAVFVAAVPGDIHRDQTTYFKIIGSSPFDAVVSFHKFFTGLDFVCAGQIERVIR